MATQRKPKPTEHTPPADFSKDVVILVGHQSGGATYGLHPLTLNLLKSKYQAHNLDVYLVPAVFIGYQSRADFERIHGPMWKQIARILCGVHETKLRALGLNKILINEVGHQWHDADAYPATDVEEQSHA